MTVFEKAWYDNIDWGRGLPKDSIRLPGYTGPSGQDRRSHFRPEMKWLNRNPMDEGGWSLGRRLTDDGQELSVWNAGDYTDEEKRRQRLNLALARLPMEFNRPLGLEETMDLVEDPDDIQYLVDIGVLPSFMADKESLRQTAEDLDAGTKDNHDIIEEAFEDGYVPPNIRGHQKNEYFMSHDDLDRLNLMDRMRAVINARLMDVPREQLLTLVDRKSMAPKVMDDWYESTRPMAGSFGHGEWQGHTPRTSGALVRDTKELSRLDGQTNLFDDIMDRIGKQPEMYAAFRRLLSSEAADLLNTMDDRRQLDRIDSRGMPFSDVGRYYGPMQGPVEDFGDVEIRDDRSDPRMKRSDPFSEEFQIMNRSSDSFDDAWSITKYRKLPHCPYCEGNLNLSHGRDGEKFCERCRRTVRPFYKYQGGY